MEERIDCFQRCLEEDPIVLADAQIIDIGPLGEPEKVRVAVKKELLKPALETVTEPSENSYPGPRPASGTSYRR